MTMKRLAMSNLTHILEGWGKSLGWLSVDPVTAKMSEERLKICSTCPMAKESKFLKLFRGEGRELDAIYCTGCGCPVNEKSLVPTEKCPQNKWK